MADAGITVVYLAGQYANWGDVSVSELHRRYSMLACLRSYWYRDSGAKASGLTEIERIFEDVRGENKQKKNS